MKRWICLLLCVTLVTCLLFGCDPKSQPNTETDPADADFSKTDADMFTDRDTNADFTAEGSVNITLSGDTATANGSGVTIDGSNITITGEGTYVLTGTLTEGQIIVDAGESAKLQLVLDGVSVTSSTCAALYILSADKVFITLAEGTENSFRNGGAFEAIDENNIDGAVYSKQDLTFNGTGALTVTSPAGHGIVCKDDLVFTGGTYRITSASHGLDANDSVRIAGAEITIDAGKDGIHVENTDDATLGFVYISGGSFTIASADDAVHASSDVLINGGTWQIASGDDGVHSDTMLTVTAGEFVISQSYEGLEAEKIYIKGGEFEIHASDDGLNAAGGADSSGAGGRDEMFGGRPGGGRPGGGMGANADACIKISGGHMRIYSGGDGLDSNGSLLISGGYTYVTNPTSGDVSVLDSQSTPVITGGTYIGLGISGHMAQSFGGGSTQGVLACTCGTQPAGSALTVKDSGGKEILSLTTEYKTVLLIISTPQIISGENYDISIGEVSGTLTAD